LANEKRASLAKDVCIVGRGRRCSIEIAPGIVDPIQFLVDLRAQVQGLAILRVEAYTNPRSRV